MKQLISTITIVLSVLYVNAQSGFLDTAFASKGILVSEFNGLSNVVACQKDRKIIAAGLDELWKGILMARYNEDGSLDYTFADSGLSHIPLPTSGRVLSINILKDDKILLCGNFNGADVSLARYMPDGKLDISFGENGIVTTDWGASELYPHANIQSDEKIVVAGNYNTGVNDNDRTYLVRYLPDGAIDESFGDKGKIITTHSSIILFADISIQSDDKILIAGTIDYVTDHSYFEVTRYMPDGSIDSNFGKQGVAKGIFSGYQTDMNAIALQDDGKIVTAGYGATFDKEGFVLIRFETNGSVDKSFGEKGLVVTSFDSSGSLAKTLCIQKDQKIIAAGSRYDAYATYRHFALARYNTDGSLDQSFGDNGKQFTDAFPTTATANSACLQQDGKIILTGTGGSPFTFMLARYFGDPVQIYIAKDIQLKENNAGFIPATFHVALNNISALPVKVKYRTVNGTATAGKDYIADSGFVTIRPGQTNAPITIQVAGDNNKEQNEYFSLEIGEPTNAILGATTAAACIIKNDDSVAGINDDYASWAKNIKLSSNPVKDMLQLSGLNAATTANITIANLQGTIVDAAEINNSSSYRKNIAQLQHGAYYIKIQQGQKVSTLMFMKE